MKTIITLALLQEHNIDLEAVKTRVYNKETGCCYGATSEIKVPGYVGEMNIMGGETHEDYFKNLWLQIFNSYEMDEDDFEEIIDDLYTDLRQAFFDDTSIEQQREMLGLDDDADEDDIQNEVDETGMEFWFEGINYESWLRDALIAELQEPLNPNVEYVTNVLTQAEQDTLLQQDVLSVMTTTEKHRYFRDVFNLFPEYKSSALVGYIHQSTDPNNLADGLFEDMLLVD